MGEICPTNTPSGHEVNFCKSLQLLNNWLYPCVYPAPKTLDSWTEDKQLEEAQNKDQKHITHKLRDALSVETVYYSGAFKKASFPKHS